MSIILRPTDEELEKAEKKLNLLLASKRKNFKSLLISSLHSELNKFVLLNRQKDAEELKILIEEVSHDSPRGLQELNAYKEQLLLTFIAQQRELENESQP
ncbi:MAG TPA: hypothetical protein PLP33_14595 [Leptospiraceae bacterium]|nr:hypothetical protein [Leptospiraceae bacterium]